MSQYGNSINGLNNTISELSTNINKFYKIDGSKTVVNPVSDINNFYTGIGLFSGSTLNLPTENWWFILSSGDSGTTTQIAFNLWHSNVPKIRYCAASNWGEWMNINKLSDTYNSSVSSGNASGGIGASQNALFNAYNDLNSKITTTNTNINTLKSNVDTNVDIIGTLGNDEKISIDVSKYKFVFFLLNGSHVSDTFSIMSLKHSIVRKTYIVTDNHSFSIKPVIDENNNLSVDLQLTGFSSGAVSVHCIKY